MLHTATFTIGNAIGKPFHVVCSCGTGGDFASKATAKSYIQGHFKNLRGMSRTMVIDKSPDTVPQSAIAQPQQSSTAAHIGGVGAMPASHAQKVGPPAPPPPPSATKSDAVKVAQPVKKGPPPPPPPPPASKK